MRDPSASSLSALKRAAPVEDGLMPEQFFTLNPEFLTDTEKWTYRDLQVCEQMLSSSTGSAQNNCGVARPFPIPPCRLTSGAAAQRLAKQLGVPGGGKGSRKQLEERLANFNR
jgi:hypothetical protein